MADNHENIDAVLRKHLDALWKDVQEHDLCVQCLEIKLVTVMLMSMLDKHGMVDGAIIATQAIDDAAVALNRRDNEKMH